MNEIIYFELNNWCVGKDYPDEEPFTSWLSDDCNIIFDDEAWIKDNRLCVIIDLIDMSCNYCITATREWVESNCPKLLTEHKSFLRYANEDGEVIGRFGNKFLEYKEENIGLHFDSDFWGEV